MSTAPEKSGVVRKSGGLTKKEKRKEFFRKKAELEKKKSDLPKSSPLDPKTDTPTTLVEKMEKLQLKPIFFVPQSETLSDVQAAEMENRGRTPLSSRAPSPTTDPTRQPTLEWISEELDYASRKCENASHNTDCIVSTLKDIHDDVKDVVSDVDRVHLKVKDSDLVSQVRDDRILKQLGVMFDEFSRVKQMLQNLGEKLEQVNLKAETAIKQTYVLNVNVNALAKIVSEIPRDFSVPNFPPPPDMPAPTAEELDRDGKEPEAPKLEKKIPLDNKEEKDNKHPPKPTLPPLPHQNRASLISGFSGAGPQNPGGPANKGDEKEAKSDDKRQEVKDAPILDFKYVVEYRTVQTKLLKWIVGRVYNAYEFLLVGSEQRVILEDRRPLRLQYSTKSLTITLSKVYMKRTTFSKFCGVTYNSDTHEEKFQVCRELFAQLVSPLNVNYTYDSVDTAKRIAQNATDPYGINYDRYLDVEAISSTAAVAWHYSEYIKYKHRSRDFYGAQGVQDTPQSTVTDARMSNSQRLEGYGSELSSARSFGLLTTAACLYLPRWAYIQQGLRFRTLMLSTSPLLYLVSRGASQEIRLRSNSPSLQDYSLLRDNGSEGIFSHLTNAVTYLWTTGWNRLIIPLPGVRSLRTVTLNWYNRRTEFTRRRLDVLLASLRTNLIFLGNTLVVFTLGKMISKLSLVRLSKLLKPLFTATGTL